MAFIEVEKDGPVTIVRMNRPERLNAMGRELLIGLAQAFTNFADDTDSSVLVLTGTGRSFSVGLDIKEAAQSGDGGLNTADISPHVNPFFPYRSATFTKPVIAAVNGLAYGGGFFLAANADLIVASAKADFEISEVAIGGAIGWWFGYTLNLPRNIATELALGRKLSAERAYQVGMVNELTADEDLMPAALRLAHYIAALPPLVRCFNLELASALSPGIPEDVWQRGRERLRQTQASEDMKEAQRAFIEKRRPLFTGR